MINTIFLDRDGTLIKEKHYLSDPDELEFEDNSIEGLQKLSRAGKKLIMITNQSGIGRGYFTVEDFLTVQRRLLDMYSEKHIHFTDFYYCPYIEGTRLSRFQGSAKNRKPNPGMLLNAIEDHQLSPETCLMIGDKPADINAAKNANLRSILVKTGYGSQAAEDPNLNPSYSCNNLNEAAEHILML